MLSTSSALIKTHVESYRCRRPRPGREDGRSDATGSSSPAGAGWRHAMVNGPERRRHASTTVERDGGGAETDGR